MVIHGMMYDFPRSFCAASTAGIRPGVSHLRYVTDFCNWNGRWCWSRRRRVDHEEPDGRPVAVEHLVRRRAKTGHLRAATGWGGPWLYDAVKAGQPSVPFLVNGFAAAACTWPSAGRRPGLTESASGEVIHRCTGVFP